MHKASAVFALVVLAALVWVFFNRESGHDREMKKLIQSHADKMDSSNLVAESWRLKALEYGNQQRKDATRAMKAEERLNYALEENRILKNRRVIRYSEPQLDSAMSARYPK